MPKIPGNRNFAQPGQPSFPNEYATNQRNQFAQQVQLSNEQYNSTDQQKPLDGMSNTTQVFNVYNQPGQDMAPDPKSYRLKQRRKAIRKPSLERQGGFEQYDHHDENFPSEQGNQALIEQQNKMAQNIPNKMTQSIPNQMTQNIPKQMTQSIPNQVTQNMSNQMNNPSVPYMTNDHFSNNATDKYQHPPALNENKNGTFRQESYESFTNSGIPELEMDNSEVYYNYNDKNDKQNKSMQEQAATKQEKMFQSKLQSQDTLTSDIVNLNFDSGDWSNEQEQYFLDQQYEENWSRRQAQFENDANSQIKEFPRMEDKSFGNKQSMDNSMSKWNQSQQVQQQANEVNLFPKKDIVNNREQQNSMMGNFGDSNQPKVDYSAPSIVISNTDYSESNQANVDHTFQTMPNQTTTAISTSADESRKDFSAVSNQKILDTNSVANEHNQLSQMSQKFDSNVNDPAFYPTNNSAMQFGSEDISSNTVIPSAIKNETKTVKFSEEIDKKSPPNVVPEIGSSMFGDGQLVVQTNTEGMSRARVRWITAFNKITSHLNEVNRMSGLCQASSLIYYAFSFKELKASY